MLLVVSRSCVEALSHTHSNSYNDAGSFPVILFLLFLSLFFNVLALM